MSAPLVLTSHTIERATAPGFVGRGGTLTISGMPFVNRRVWAHILLEAARLLELRRDELLYDDGLAALDGRASPENGMM